MVNINKLADELSELGKVSDIISFQVKEIANDEELLCCDIIKSCVLSIPF